MSRSIRRRPRRAGILFEALERRQLLTAISSGERLSGNIAAAGATETYTFDANFADSVSIVVGSLGGVNFFPRIQVLAPNGIAMNSAGTDFEFDFSGLVQTGTYSIVVRDDNNANTGSFALTMVKAPGTQLVDADSAPIASGERKTGSIDSGDLDVYTMSASAGDSMSAVVGSTGGTNFFPRIQVFAPNGVPLNAPGAALAFDTANLPQTGTYYVVVRDDNNLNTGSYGLSVIKTPGTQTVDLDSGPIASAERRTGSIDAGDQDVYTISANAGDSMSVVVGSTGGTNFFPRIQVFTPSGVPLNSAGTDFAFDSSNLPQTGTYYVVVRDENNLNTGTYGVTVIKTPGAQTVDADSGPIGSNQRRTGSIEFGDQDAYTFDANAGDSVTAVVGSLGGTNFFPRIQVFAPSGLPLNDAGTALSFDAQSLPQTGTYYVVVRDDNNLSVGRYAVSVARVPGAQVPDTLDNDGGAISSGQSGTGAITAGDLDVYTINLTAGSSMTARMGFVSGTNFFPRMDLYAPNGVRIASQIASPVVITLDPAPITGTYFLVARDDNDLNPGNYSISIDTALAPDTRVPEVTQTRFDFNTSRQQVVFTMNENVAASVAAADLTLENLTENFTVPTANILASFNTASNELVFQFQNYPFLALPDGDYRATMNAQSVSDIAGNTLPQSVSFDFFFLNGDANRDRRVSLQDFNILTAQFGLTTRVFVQADFNYDGSTTLADFNILSGQFGKQLPDLPGAGNSGGNALGNAFGDRKIGFDDHEALRDLLD